MSVLNTILALFKWLVLLFTTLLMTSIFGFKIGVKNHDRHPCTDRKLNSLSGYMKIQGVRLVAKCFLTEYEYLNLVFRA